MVTNIHIRHFLGSGEKAQLLPKSLLHTCHDKFSLLLSGLHRLKMEQLSSAHLWSVAQSLIDFNNLENKESARVTYWRGGVGLMALICMCFKRVMK